MDPRPGREVTAQYAHALLQAAQETGIALDEALVARLRGAERVPLAWQDELWEEYCAGADDPLAGLRLGLRMQVGHLDSAGMLLVTCATLGEALEELTAYAPVIGPGAFALHRDGPLVRVEFDHDFGVRPLERTEAALTTLLHLARWATGGHVAPVALELTHPAPGAEPAHAAVLGVPVRFDAAGHALVLEAAQLDLPLVQANAALRDHLRELADRTLARLGEQDLAVRVREVVLAHPEWGRERVAEHLAHSGRHLNRLLAERGLSFSAVRERTLEQLAVRALERGERVSDVALRLGYSDETAFTRAFRRWRGETPGQARARATGEARPG
jgi:AraC-like DNA-binding protein